MNTDAETSTDPELLRLSLVIPCYNEADNLPLLVERCRGVFSDPRDEVVLVDNGSKDKTAEILPGLLEGQTRVRSVRVPVNQGYGFGITEGLRATRGRYVGWTHADMQTDPYDAVRGIELFEKSDAPDGLFVKGLRKGRPLSDEVFTVGMSVFESFLLQQKLWDINAQPTLFPKSFFEEWKDEAPKDFSLDLFAYFKARQSNLKVERFEVTFGERAHGTSHWNVDWASKYKFIKRTVDFSLELRRRVDEGDQG